MNTKKNIISRVLCLVLAAIMTFSFAACNKKAADMDADVSTTTTTAAATKEAVKTEGTKDAPVVKGTMEGAQYGFHFEVKTAENEVSYYDVYSNKSTVGAALLELGMIAGEDSEYGLYVKEVNGVKADYDTDGTYWAFYVNGDYAMTGVDSTDIENGSTYTFAVEKA